MVQLSHPYMNTGKTIALTIQTFVGKEMSLLFYIMSRFVVAFLPRRKHLLISWLQSLSAVILEPKKIKSVTVSIVSLSICHEVMRPYHSANLSQLLPDRNARPISSTHLIHSAESLAYQSNSELVFQTSAPSKTTFTTSRFLLPILQRIIASFY